MKSKNKVMLVGSILLTMIITLAGCKTETNESYLIQHVTVESPEEKSTSKGETITNTSEESSPTGQSSGSQTTDTGASPENPSKDKSPDQGETSGNTREESSSTGQSSDSQTTDTGTPKDEPSEDLEGEVEPTPEMPVTYTVTFDTNGGSSVAKQVIKEGELVQTPTSPSKQGYVFDYWYTSTDEGKTVLEKFYFTNQVTSDITLYAKYSARGSVGNIAYSDGSVSSNYDSSKVAVGIVVDAPGGIVKKILSLSYTEPAFAQWGTGKEVSIGATSETDGLANLNAIKSINNWREIYPIFKFTDEYTDASGNSDWYLPAIDELDAFYEYVDTLNNSLKKIIDGNGSATEFHRENHWSSTVTTDTFRPIAYRFAEDRTHESGFNQSIEVIKMVGFYSNSEKFRLMRYF
ncbi:MAG: InlB B-repeat-containing protein [Treponema sp.]|nr:InlB B-repeat-containing protein [Treponema sp.]